MRAKLFSGLALLFLAACEDQGNPGNDNLFTGASLLIIIVVVLVLLFLFFRRR